MRNLMDFNKNRTILIVEAFKNLTKYRSENNFAGSSK